MNTKIKPIPDGYHSITPHLVVSPAHDAIEFYKKAFGAQECCRMPGPDGKAVMHAELQLGSSRLFLADEYPGCSRSPLSLGGSPVTIHFYVEDADAVFEQAVAAGAKVRMPLKDMFWGDRFGQLEDPFGHVWSIATHKEDPTPEQMEKRMREAFAECGK